MEYVTLMGAEDVQRAGNIIASAAESFSHSAARMEQALQDHSRSMVDSIKRLEILTEELRGDEGLRV